MKTRIISAAVAIALLVGVLIAAMFQPWCIAAVFALLGAIAALEMAKTTGLEKHPAVCATGVLFAAFCPASLLCPAKLPLTETLYLVYIVFLFCAKLFRYEQIHTTNILLCGGMTAYIAYGFTAAARVWYSNGCASLAMFLFLLSMAMAWFADTGAYFVGVFLGKHKLCPKISPKKTVEGFFGGIGGCILLTALSAMIYTRFINTAATVSWLGLIVISAVCAVISVVGDLTFSVIKRHYGIKDYGKLMPGHGGVLDRFDSVLLVAPVFGLFLQYLPIVHA